MSIIVLSNRNNFYGDAATSNQIFALLGDDTIYGNDGNDYLSGGTGDDFLYGDMTF